MLRPLSGRYSTRLHLFGLVAAVVIPLIAFAALVVFRYAKAEQARVEQEAVRIAGQTALLVEADLRQLVAKLEGLASSSALAADDFARFHAEASQLTAGREETIILRDLGVRQLLNSQVPFGTELPSGPPFSAEERARFDQGGPYVSDVYLSPRNREPRIVMALPIMRERTPKYIIGITIPTARVRDALISAVPPAYIVAVGDRKGAYVARSARHEEVTGKPGLPEYIEKVVGPSGSFRAPNFEGRYLLAGYHRSGMTGWFFTANIPLETLERPLATTLLQLALFGAAALILSGLLAVLFTRPIAAAADGLAERARRLGDDGQVAPLASHLAEFALISDALVDAGGAIATRAAERARASEREALLASIFDAVGVHVGVVDLQGDDVRFVAANRAATAMFSVNARDIVGTAAGELDMQRADREAFVRLCRQACDGDEPVTAEFSLHPAANEERTYLGTFTALAAIGARRRIAFTAMDITDRKRAEVHRQLLVHELNHRVKNSLTIAQSIALQTLRSATSLQQARSALSRRLVSLGRTHDVLTRENWEGAAVADVVAHIVEPYEAADRIRTGGPAVRLLPGPALTLSLILHELLTNSSKYGAMSADAGTVTIAWSLASVEGEPRVVLTYREAGGPPVAPPAHKGFGSQLFAASFSSPAEGRITVEYPPTGSAARIEMAGVVTG